LEEIYSLCKLFFISIISLQLVKQESLKILNSENKVDNDIPEDDGGLGVDE
jgi:hypothetical protein